ncbi:NADPH-dependent 2,4-dienoyl-CoA reductase/sulfur reductase-like enzyme [Virgibacillus litoralis]|uniref:NADPH-dependent 2,4-dienoyl-CoA reductase/sulfur reductase-like enzyme n=1 Tax=Virgibacillus litoralis TaxID=578221 RepID=A0ABS4HCN5_9BACI|nr:NADPH-dependent 2,4-dienoyl-CoA reductase/sulfur reductase-like enzyme [Virgibacillus litoralis]
MNKKIVIVGGVAGGSTAAARLRRLDENANIIMFEKGEYISFANCGLPYYIGKRLKIVKNYLFRLSIVCLPDTTLIFVHLVRSHKLTAQINQ